jgi:gluconolactonase
MTERVPAEFVILDERFRACGGDQFLELLHTGSRWTEGPAYFPAGRYLVFSDIPGDRVLRWDEITGSVAAFRQPAAYANGHTVDRRGRLISCEHGGRRVIRTEHDGSVTVLADQYAGKRLNSPNDVVERADGSVWFTDPTFGIAGNYEGHKAEPELPMNVYRVDGRTGRTTAVAENIAGPNGLCFSPDETRLYLVESRAQPRNIKVFDVVGDGDRLANSRDFADLAGGTPDGFRCDIHGNLWCGWGMSAELNGVAVFAPDGTLIGRISLPERCANLCFGGLKRNRLFMAASHSLYSVYVNTQGAVGG